MPIGQLVRPIDSIGCYIPGGRFALVSTMMMTVVPAQVAGVQRHRRRLPAAERRAARRRKFSRCHANRSNRRRAGRRRARLRHEIRSRASKKSLVPAIASSPPPSNSSPPIAPSICPPAPPKRSSSPQKATRKWIAADLLAQAEHAPDAGSFLRHNLRHTRSQRAARSHQWQLNAVASECRSQRISLYVALVRFSLRLRSHAHANSSIDSRPNISALPESERRRSPQTNSARPEPFFLAPGARSLSATTPAAAITSSPLAAGRANAAAFPPPISSNASACSPSRTKDSNVSPHPRESLAESEGLLAHRNAMRIRR